MLPLRLQLQPQDSEDGVDHPSAIPSFDGGGAVRFFAAPVKQEPGKPGLLRSQSSEATQVQRLLNDQRRADHQVAIARSKSRGLHGARGMFRRKSLTDDMVGSTKQRRKREFRWGIRRTWAKAGRGFVRRSVAWQSQAGGLLAQSSGEGKRDRVSLNASGPGSDDELGVDSQHQLQSSVASDRGYFALHNEQTLPYYLDGISRFFSMTVLPIHFTKSRYQTTITKATDAMKERVSACWDVLCCRRRGTGSRGSRVNNSRHVAALANHTDTTVVSLASTVARGEEAAGSSLARPGLAGWQPGLPSILSPRHDDHIGVCSTPGHSLRPSIASAATSHRTRRASQASIRSHTAPPPPRQGGCCCMCEGFRHWTLASLARVPVLRSLPFVTRFSNTQRARQLWMRLAMMRPQAVDHLKALRVWDHISASFFRRRSRGRFGTSRFVGTTGSLPSSDTVDAVLSAATSHIMAGSAVATAGSHVSDGDSREWGSGEMGRKSRSKRRGSIDIHELPSHSVQSLTAKTSSLRAATKPEDPSPLSQATATALMSARLARSASFGERREQRSNRGVRSAHEALSSQVSMNINQSLQIIHQRRVSALPFTATGENPKVTHRRLEEHICREGGMLRALQGTAALVVELQRMQKERTEVSLRRTERIRQRAIEGQTLQLEQDFLAAHWMDFATQALHTGIMALTFLSVLLYWDELVRFLFGVDMVNIRYPSSLSGGEWISHPLNALRLTSTGILVVYIAIAMLAQVRFVQYADIFTGAALSLFACAIVPVAVSDYPTAVGVLLLMLVQLYRLEVLSYRFRWCVAWLTAVAYTLGVATCDWHGQCAEDTTRLIAAHRGVMVLIVAGGQVCIIHRPPSIPHTSFIPALTHPCQHPPLYGVPL